MANSPPSPSPKHIAEYRRRAFIVAYLACFNATEAAKEAGFTGDEKTLGVTGHRMMKSEPVKKAINDALAKAGISSDEVVARLVAHARADISDFITIDRRGKWKLDLAKAQKLGKLGLIKELTMTPDGPKLKLHDAQKALELLGRVHGIFVEKHEHSAPGGKPLTLKVEFDQ